MSSEEKARTSGDVVRPAASAPVLPTVNPAVEKPASPQAAFHPAVYIMYVRRR